MFAVWMWGISFISVMITTINAGIENEIDTRLVCALVLAVPTTLIFTVISIVKCIRAKPGLAPESSDYFESPPAEIKPSDGAVDPC